MRMDSIWHLEDRNQNLHDNLQHAYQQLAAKEEEKRQLRNIIDVLINVSQEYVRTCGQEEHDRYVQCKTFLAVYLVTYIPRLQTF